MTIYIKLDNRNTAVLNYNTMNSNPHYRMITNLNVPIQYRKRGIAHKLLASLCDLADREDFIVFAYVIRSKDIGNNDFVKMMQKHGFKLIRKEVLCRSNISELSKNDLLEIVNEYEEME